MMRLLGASLSSALVLFVWGGVSLLVVPWHDSVVLPVSDEGVVLEVLERYATQAGVYAVPVAHAEYTGESPFAMVIYRPHGLGMPMSAVMLVSFATYWVAALVAAALLVRRRDSGYGSRVVFVIGLATFAWLVTHVSNWTWMGYSPGFTLVAALDLLVGWTLAGLVLAGLVVGEEEAR